MRDENGKRDGNPECRQTMIWDLNEVGRSLQCIIWEKGRVRKCRSRQSEQKLEHLSLPQLYFIIHDHVHCNYEPVCIAFLIFRWPYYVLPCNLEAAPLP